MKDWISAESFGHSFFYAFPICLIILLALLKGRRLRFLIPGLVITLVIVNPFFYKYWEDLGLYAYWRILWVVPVIPVIACTLPAITEKINSGLVKTAIVIVAVAAVAFGGTFIYSSAAGRFVVSDISISKVPTSVEKIANRLLELEDQPCVILQDPLGVYIRQYSGKIKTLFGRDISGFIYNSSEMAKSIHRIINSGTSDFREVSQFMLDDEYGYLVMRVVETDDSLELIDTVDGYGIYRAHGKPGVKKEKNELGQVLRETIIDENGNPVNGENGYSVTTYEYDNNGNIIREFRTDAEGMGVADGKGQAGYEREYDSWGNVRMERFLGADGKPVVNEYGFAETRWHYEGKRLLGEAYFDEAGNPVVRIDKQYAKAVYELDKNKHAIHEQYYDSEGNPAIWSNGYAEIRRTFGAEYEGNYVTHETYYDTSGNPTRIYKGYASLSRTYDQKGNITSESYEDEYGQAIECINGYARVEREYDENNRIIRQIYYNAKNKPVEIYTGYAEVYREYDNQGRLALEQYYDANGWPKAMPAGHEGIKQEYDENGRLIARKYLNSYYEPVVRPDGYSEARWQFNEDTGTYDVQFYTADGKKATPDGLNLTMDVQGDDENWSAWMTPTYNINNAAFEIASMNLGNKKVGDIYTCQLEIEYRGVQSTEGRPFRFLTQGSVDSLWTVGNVWNNQLINLNDFPEDGVYTYTATITINEKMAQATTFKLGFRCDYWSSGMFRVRKVKVERGDTATEWTPGV